MSTPQCADGVGKPPVDTLDVDLRAKWRPMATTAIADGVGRHQVAIAGHSSTAWSVPQYHPAFIYYK